MYFQARWCYDVTFADLWGALYKPFKTERKGVKNLSTNCAKKRITKLIHEGWWKSPHLALKYLQILASYLPTDASWWRNCPHGKCQDIAYLEPKHVRCTYPHEKTWKYCLRSAKKCEALLSEQKCKTVASEELEPQSLRKRCCTEGNAETVCYDEGHASPSCVGSQALARPRISSSAWFSTCSHDGKWQVESFEQLQVHRSKQSSEVGFRSINWLVASLYDLLKAAAVIWQHPTGKIISDVSLKFAVPASCFSESPVIMGSQNLLTILWCVLQ